MRRFGSWDKLYVATGGLFALHPSNTDLGNIGRTCRQIAFARGTDLDRFASRFNRLVACQTADELALHLPAVVTLAKSCRVSINYRQLFTDLWGWHWYREDIRVRWAKEFWNDSTEATTAKTQTEE